MPFIVGVCGILKIGSDSVLTTEPSKKLTSIQMTETVCGPQFKLKVTKSNFTCIQFADTECFKTSPKRSLAYRFFLLTTITKSGMHSLCNIAVTL